jgi:hypothetical protein
VSQRASDAIVLDGRVTKNADLFVAWRYVAAMPRLPKNFLQPFPRYGWCDRDRPDRSANGPEAKFCRAESANQSIADAADLR